MGKKTALFIISLLFIAMVCYSVIRGGAISVDKSGEGALTGIPDHESSLVIRGHVFKIKTPVQVTAKDILVTDGPEGFYWSLPQDPGDERMGYITGPAIIRYTPYDRQGTIDPAAERVIYQLPLPDICNTGAWTGSLRLVKLVLHGKRLFYFYDSEMKDAAQSSYVALGALDASASHPETTARFLYIGENEGGGQLEWAVSSDFVVWQQGYPDITGGYGLSVTTSLYDLATGMQQALPLPVGEMTQLSFAGNKLQYRDWNSQGPYQVLPLPPPGSARLVSGARRLPAVAFGEAAQFLNKFRGTVYLPAVVDPAPYYQVKTESDATHYRVTFDASDHPVPLNATDQERLELGVGPSLAQTLGSIVGYGGSPPPAVKKLTEEVLSQGKLFSIHVGRYTVAGHFLSPSPNQVSVWWQDGSWRYRLLNLDRMWQSPVDSDLQRVIAEITSELPPDGKLVPSSDQGEVSITLAPDHRATGVWFRHGAEWLDLEGYGYDAVRGAQGLVDIGQAD